MNVFIRENQNHAKYLEEQFGKALVDRLKKFDQSTLRKNDWWGKIPPLLTERAVLNEVFASARSTFVHHFGFDSKKLLEKSLLAENGVSLTTIGRTTFAVGAALYTIDKDYFDKVAKVSLSRTTTLKLNESDQLKLQVGARYNVKQRRLSGGFEYKRGKNFFVEAGMEHVDNKDKKDFEKWHVKLGFRW